jgi:hypothetical protein
VPVPSSPPDRPTAALGSWKVVMRYEFIVRDAVSDDVAAELPELAYCAFPTGGTSLFGSVQDEADVLTLLARLHDLGLTVVEMRQLPD